MVISACPNNSIQEGNMLNGNLVLISKKVFNSLGNLSNNYTHAMGDHDYGLRAIEKGIKLITTRFYIATCASNKGTPNWCNPNISLVKRWSALNSPLGLNLKEYRLFKNGFGQKAITFQ